MSQKLIIVFAVIAAFIGNSSSSSKVEVNLPAEVKAEGKHYVFLSLLM
jgi:hypothetical protein